jgi:hypothetical protein
MMTFHCSKIYEWAAILVCILFANAGAFVLKTNLCHFRPSCRSNHEIVSGGQNFMISLAVTQDFNLMRSVIDPTISSSFLVSDAMAIVTNVFIGIGGIATVLVLLGFLTTSYIVPTAVKQVETLANELDPDLWNEYQRKLGPEETLAMRPDLLQELGNKVLQLQQEQFAKEMLELDAELESQENGRKGNPARSTEQPKSKADTTIIDIDTTTTSSKWDD